MVNDGCLFMAIIRIGNSNAFTMKNTLELLADGLTKLKSRDFIIHRFSDCRCLDSCSNCIIVSHIREVDGIKTKRKSNLSCTIEWNSLYFSATFRTIFVPNIWFLHFNSRCLLFWIQPIQRSHTNSCFSFHRCSPYVATINIFFLRRFSVPAIRSSYS